MLEKNILFSALEMQTLYLYPEDASFYILFSSYVAFTPKCAFNSLCEQERLT